MIELIDKNTLAFDRTWLHEFCLCTDKDSPISFSSQDGVVSVFFQNHYKTVLSSFTLESALTFSVGVDSEKLTKAAKQLRDGKVHISVTKKSFLLSQDNVKVTLPLLDGKYPSQLPQFSALEGSHKDALTSSIIQCGSSIKDNPRFYGIMLDSNESALRIFKLSGVMARIVSHDPFLTPCRFVISSDFSEVLRHLSVDKLLFSDNCIGALSQSGVYCWVSLVHDVYPQEYLNYFGLVNSVDMINKSLPCYVFDKDILVNAVSIVDSVIGDDGLDVIFRPEGADQATGFPVWSINGKAIGNCKASEQVACIANTSAVIAPFGLRRKNLLNVLKVQEKKVFLYDSDSIILVTNEAGSDVSLLSKLVV